MQRILFNLFLAIEGISTNRLRSMLTALGIIFGVAAVIAMLAIGSGAKLAIMEQMKIVGANNIVIKAVVSSDDDQGNGNAGSNTGNQNRNTKPFSPGLTLEDLQSIVSTLPELEKWSAEVILPTIIVRKGRFENGRCVGVTNDFFELNGLDLAKGNFFHSLQSLEGKPVCVIGKNIQTKFFNGEEPMGKTIKCGNTWLTVIGVLEGRSTGKQTLENLGIRDFNDDIFIPVNTALLRFKNRATVTESKIRGFFDEENADKNYHQVDRAMLRVSDSQKLQANADVVARILKRRHKGTIDFEVQVPELLIESQRKTQETFNMVLAFIAGISLLIGGIGIMNIMLASVLERIQEIGVRRSLGATQRDITLQFLLEAVIISLMGGLIGIALGVVASKTIAAYAEIPTVVSAWSIIVSFGVAATVGLVFGLFPAQKAAQQDPIKALRSE